LPQYPFTAELLTDLHRRHGILPRNAGRAKPTKKKWICAFVPRLHPALAWVSTRMSIIVTLTGISFLTHPRPET
jgi:hypothetical protein